MQIFSSALGFAKAAPIIACLALPAGAEPIFSPADSAACLHDVQSNTTSQGVNDVLACIGRSADACMSKEGGDTTAGMVICLDAEREFWDDKLNAAYRARMSSALAADADMASMSMAAVSLAQSLREMQRAWIVYRDAACLYEQAQWMGGTAGGPAAMACTMHETARQALKLEGWGGY